RPLPLRQHPGPYRFAVPRRPESRADRRPDSSTVRNAGRSRAVGTTMRAVGVITLGGPEALEVVDIPEPHAGPGEVRIRVRAAAVNPTDTGLRSGARAAQLRDIPPPYVPGMDAAGVLDQIGEGVVTDLAV